MLVAAAAAAATAVGQTWQKVSILGISRGQNSGRDGEVERLANLPKIHLHSLNHAPIDSGITLLSLYAHVGWQSQLFDSLIC